MAPSCPEHGLFSVSWVGAQLIHSRGGLGRRERCRGTSEGKETGKEVLAGGAGAETSLRSVGPSR